MAHYSDGSRSKKEDGEYYFAVSFSIPLASLTATVNIPYLYPIDEHCRCVRLTATATTVASTASRGCTVRVQRVKGRSAATAAATALPWSELNLLTAEMNVLGETNTTDEIPDSAETRFEPGDGFNLNCTAVEAGGAFAQGVGQFVVWFKRVLP